MPVKKAVKKPAPKPLPLPVQVVNFARTLLGIREEPVGSHSNDGKMVHLIQSSTGAYRLPWCVSTVQYICLKVLGHTIADKTASAYYLADFAARQGWVVPHPQIGFVVYHIGQGHAGTVVSVHTDGTFDAIEGNEGDAVNLVHRDPRTIRCTFIVPPSLA